CGENQRAHQRFGNHPVQVQRDCFLGSCGRDESVRRGPREKTRPRIGFLDCRPRVLAGGVSTEGLAAYLETREPPFKGKSKSQKSVVSCPHANSPRLPSQRHEAY